MPVRLPSLLNPDKIVVWAAEVVRGLEITLGNFDRLKQTKGSIGALAPYYKAELPSPEPAWQYLVVIDDGATPAVCYSDGSAWRRFSDNSIVV